MYDAEKQLVLNWDGSTSAAAHQYDRNKEVSIVVKTKKRQFEQQWKALRKCQQRLQTVGTTTDICSVAQTKQALVYMKFVYCVKI